MSLYIMNPGTSEDMRSLIVNDVEKYRLEIDNKLVYAKGKINFDWNPPKNGENIIYKIPSNDNLYTRWYDRNYSYWAFYNDGFYRKLESIQKIQDKSNSHKYTYRYFYTKLDFKNPHTNWSYTEDLTGFSLRGWGRGYSGPGEDQQATDLPPGVIFCGWLYIKKPENTLNDWDIKKYTINNIEDIAKKTNLFDYKENDDLPQITLYAYWKVREIDLIVANIVDVKNSKSSFEYKQGNEWIKTNGVKTFKIKDGTDMVKFLKNNTRNLSYISWAAGNANTYLKEKEDRKALKASRNFRGWYLNSFSDYSTWRNWKDRFHPVKYNNNFYNYSKSFICYWTTVHENYPWHTSVYIAVPIFETTIIYPATEYPNGKKFNGKIVFANETTVFKTPNGNELQYHPPAPKYHNTPGHHIWKNYYARYNKTVEKTTDGNKTYYKFYYWTRKRSDPSWEWLGNETIIMEFKYYGYRHIDKDGREWTFNNRK